MYEWLEQEIAEIQTRSFHVVDGPRPTGQSEAREEDALPASYRAFVLRFGNARLYRQGSGYAVGVRAELEPSKSAAGEPLQCIGHFEDARAYFRDDLLVPGEEPPVFEWGSGGLRLVADSFKDWLESRCALVRRRFGKKRWAEIIRGPKPFTDEEQAIVEARRQFRWCFLGVGEKSVLRYEVENGSSRTLPYLSIGIRSKDGRIAGGVWLPVSHVAPGTRAIVEKECYRNIAAPEDLVPFALPDPGPEDRERYWEFR